MNLTSFSEVLAADCLYRIDCHWTNEIRVLPVLQDVPAIQWVYTPPMAVNI